MTDRASRYRVPVVLAVLVLMHFTVRRWVGDHRAAPDFLLLALMLYAIRSRPGHAAIAGLIVGLVGDALEPVVFGAGALAHTVVGYLQAWGKAVFFPDNVMVNAGFFLAGAWCRDLLVLLAGGHVRGTALIWQLTTWSLLQAVTTTLTGLVVVVAFRRWFKMGFAQ